jgi:hypothetical protein
MIPWRAGMRRLAAIPRQRPEAWSGGSAEPRPTHCGPRAEGGSWSFDALPLVSSPGVGGEHSTGTSGVLVCPREEGVPAALVW